MVSEEPPPDGGGPERFEPAALDSLRSRFGRERLPAGRHRLPRSFVARNQRLRLIAAMLEVLPQHGYSGTTIGHLAKTAGVSRAAFYAQFESKEECFLATYDLAAQWLCERVERAVTADEEWVARVSAGASEALRLLAANPQLAHLISVEPMRAGSTARARQQAFLARFAGVLRAGRPSDSELPAELEDLLLGGALSLIARYVDSGRATQLSEVTVELLQYLLIPYLGPGETKRIAAEAA